MRRIPTAGCVAAVLALAVAATPAVAQDSVVVPEIPPSDAVPVQYQDVASDVSAIVEAAAPRAVAPASTPDLTSITTPDSDITSDGDGAISVKEPSVPSAGADPAPEPASTSEPRPPSPPEGRAEPDPAPPAGGAPVNVNVSIRIASPGDDGPVVQVNDGSPDARPNTGSTPTTGSSLPGLPDDWDWRWTSACFGDLGDGPELMSWNWDWSCGEDIAADAVPELAPISMVDVAAAVDVLGEPPAAADLPLPPTLRVRRAVAPRKSRARDARERGHGPARAGPPPAAGSSQWQPPASLAAVTARSAPVLAGPAARPPHARGKRSASGGVADVLPVVAGTGTSGAGAGAASGGSGGLGAAILISLLALFIPAFFRLIRPGPGRRPPGPRAARLERPG